MRHCTFFEFLLNFLIYCKGMITKQEVNDLPLSRLIELFGEGEAVEYTGYQGDGTVAKEVHLDAKDEL